MWTGGRESVRMYKLCVCVLALRRTDRACANADPQVGDNENYCQSLACIGGLPGPCSKRQGNSSAGAGMQVG